MSARRFTRKSRAVEWRIADLGGDLLGQAAGGIITLDDDDAGYGWFVDPTPNLDEEFTTRAAVDELFARMGSPAEKRVDLLTVLLHELGHVLGDGHTAAADLMSPALVPGVRRVPDRAPGDRVFESSELSGAR